MGKEWIEKKLLLRDLGDYLEDHPNVARVQRNHFFLRITFDTGKTEYWSLNDDSHNKNPYNSFTPDFERLHTDFKPTKYRQFAVNQFLYPEKFELLKTHFIIKAKDLQKMGWVDVRFFIHDFAVELVKEGWIDIQYDTPLLWGNVDEVLESKLSHFQSNLIRFSPFRFRPVGRRLVLHFMPSDVKNYWDFNHIWKALNVLHKQKRDFTRENIVYTIGRQLKHVARHPSFYRALFKQWFNVDGKRVYDMNPDWGFTALAVLVDGGVYLHPTMGEEYDSGVKKMAEFMESSAGTETDDIDFLIANDVFQPATIEQAEEILASVPFSEYTMITIVTGVWKEAVEKFKPWRALRVRAGIEGPKKDNQLLIIKNTPR
jgi:hypothetical protein